jgi:hypothetical protein
MMTTLVDRFNDMDGSGYGVRIEMAPCHPGLGAVTVPWLGSRQWKVWLNVFDCPLPQQIGSFSSSM